MTKDTTDCALLLEAIAGHDPRTLLQFRARPGVRKALDGNVKDSEWACRKNISFPE